VSLSLISSRRRPEYLNLQVIWGFIILGDPDRSRRNLRNLVFGGHQLTGGVNVTAALGQAALIAGASLAVAGTVGFLFAVPRTIRADRGREGDDGEAWGTNLETISDWLVKMLIGAALVALANIGTVGEKLQAFVAIGEGSRWGERTGSLIVFYFAFLGFIGGYTLARMQFLMLLDRSPLIVTALEALKRVPIGPEGLQRAGLSIEELTAVEAFSRLPETELRLRNERRQWAKAQLLANGGNLPSARKVYEQLVRDDPDPRLYAEYTAVVRRIGDPDAAKLVVNQSAPDSAADSSLSARTAIDQMFASLYQPSPEGFEEAIKLGEDLVQRVQDASVWAYLACAYGQKYRYYQDRPNLSGEELARMRERALFCVKQALDLDAARWRPTLRSLWDRNAIRPEGDDDLVVFSDDTQFAALLDPEALSSTTAISENLAAGLGSALLGPPRLIRYSGVAQLWLTSTDGTRLEGADLQLQPGQAYRLVMRLVPEAAAVEASSVTPTSPQI
jgi:tetratricopeptide (TPR) repeat protein